MPLALAGCVRAWLELKRSYPFHFLRGARLSPLSPRLCSRPITLSAREEPPTLGQIQPIQPVTGSPVQLPDFPIAESVQSGSGPDALDREYTVSPGSRRRRDALPRPRSRWKRRPSPSPLKHWHRDEVSPRVNPDRSPVVVSGRAKSPGNRPPRPAAAPPHRSKPSLPHNPSTPGQSPRFGEY